MPSVVITGANRGIGEAFVKHYAANNYHVFGLVRDKTATDAKFAPLNLPNTTFIEAHITSSTSMHHAAAAVSAATGGTLDILIPNAGTGGERHRWKTLPEYPTPDLEEDLKECFDVNVVGVANTITPFLPLLRAGGAKKVAVISSAMGLDTLVTSLDLAITAPYAVSKAAVNMLVAKYQAAVKGEGVVVFGISPGMVSTDMGRVKVEEMTEGEKAAMGAMGEKFAKLVPEWDGQPITPEQSAGMCAAVIEGATVEGVGGEMVSQFGDKRWL